jgi:hypothetical protein
VADTKSRDRVGIFPARNTRDCRFGRSLVGPSPLPRECLALPEMLCGQICCIAMVFPLLGASTWAIAISLVLMLPFDALAGLLSNTPAIPILRGFGTVAIWLVGLTSWRRFLGPSGTNQLVVTAALLFSVGGAMWDYMAWEAALADGRGNAFSAISVLPQVCRAIGENRWLAWVETALPFFLLLPVALAPKLRSERSKASSDSLHQTP